MVAAAAWRDTMIEYLVMEIPGLFIPLLVAPTHLWVTWLYLMYHATTAAIDHSGFNVNWFIDATYHHYHHALLDCNYGEAEFLDRLFGTHNSKLFPNHPGFGKVYPPTSAG